MHFRHVAAALALTAGLSSAALAQGGDLVRNGDFEADGPVAAWRSLPAGATGIAGWRITAGYVDLVGRWWQPAGGGASVEIGTPGPGAIEQRVPTIPGRRYRLTFALAGNPEGPPRVKALIVTAGPLTRTVTFDSAGHSRQAMGWRTETLDFTAASRASTIGFARADGSPRTAWWGPAVDDVSVVPLDAAGSAPAALATPGAPVAPAAPEPAVHTMAPRPVAASAAPAPAAFTPTGSDPYSGIWVGAYPGKPLRVYLERHGDEVAARVVDGGTTMPTGRLAWSGRVNRSPPVVLGACADASANGWHGAVIEWVRQDAFQLHVANCHAGDVRYTRYR